MAVSLPIIRRLTLSLLNAAGWTNIVDAAITSGAAVLTAPTSTPFASTDIGKSVYIVGAGASGSTHSTTISAYTSAGQVTVAATAGTTVSSAVASFGGDPDDARRNVMELDETILMVDLEVCRTILETPNHSRWGDFTLVTTSGVASGTQIVGHAGTIQNIQRVRTDGQTVPATLVPYRTLAGWARNAGSQYSTANIKENYVAISSGHIHFAGGGTVTYKSVNLSKGTDTQSPAEYYPTVARGVLGVLLHKEGEDGSSAGAFQQQYVADLQSIRAGNLMVPPLGRQEARG